MAGSLITVEGVEGSGKTTQCRLLAAWLRRRGHRVRETSEPDGSPIGAAVRELFERDELALTPLAEAFLFVASRQEHVAKVIRPALEAGEIVISDRYADATLAYQGYGGGLDLQTIRELNGLATGGIGPDLTLVLDLEPTLGLQRTRGRAPDLFRRDEGHDLGFFARVRQGYLELAREDKDRILVLDAARPEKEIQAEIQKLVGDLLRQRGQARGV